MKKPVLLAVVFGLLLLVTGTWIGWRWSSDKAEQWRLKAQVALADSVRVNEENAELQHRVEVLSRSVADYADRNARQDARIAVYRKDASKAALELRAYRDSVHRRADSVVPSGKLDEALAVIEQQDTVIVEQAKAIQLRDQQILAGAELRAAVEGQRDLMAGRVADLERVLEDFKPPTRPRLLGVLPAPSPTVTFLVGAAVGLALR